MPSWLEMLELNLGLFDKLKDCPTPRLISAFFLAKQKYQPVKKKLHNLYRKIELTLKTRLCHKNQDIHVTVFVGIKFKDIFIICPPYLRLG